MEELCCPWSLVRLEGRHVCLLGGERGVSMCVLVGGGRRGGKERDEALEWKCSKCNHVHFTSFSLHVVM